MPSSKNLTGMSVTLPPADDKTLQRLLSLDSHPTNEDCMDHIGGIIWEEKKWWRAIALSSGKFAAERPRIEPNALCLKSNLPWERLFLFSTPLDGGVSASHSLFSINSAKWTMTLLHVHLFCCDNKTELAQRKKSHGQTPLKRMMPCIPACSPSVLLFIPGQLGNWRFRYLRQAVQLA
jgi:hypothetical protein